MAYYFQVYWRCRNFLHLNLDGAYGRMAAAYLYRGESGSMPKLQTYPAIKQALEYIERNITQDVSVGALAREAGYSKYHFLRLFKDATGLTPAAYIRKRRLSEIARAIGVGRRPASDVAFNLVIVSKAVDRARYQMERRLRVLTS
jgi:AraC-like DNA-binding protein